MKTTDSLSEKKKKDTFVAHITSFLYYKCRHELPPCTQHHFFTINVAMNSLLYLPSHISTGFILSCFDLATAASLKVLKWSTMLDV